jgi:hypothetical protein
VIGFFLYYRNLIYYWNYNVPRLVWRVCWGWSGAHEGAMKWFWILCIYIYNIYNIYNIYIYNILYYIIFLYISNKY